jgi:hypothetical protein
MTEYSNNMGEREKIIAFLLLSDHWVHRILDEDVFIFLLPRRRQLLHEAQEAYISVNRRLNEVVENIRQLDEKEFTFKLMRNGLTGIEWKFKYSVVLLHAESLEKKINDLVFKPEDRTSGDIYGQRRTLRRYVRRLLKSIDSILDSIIGIGVHIHPLKELKDTLLSLID